MTDWRVGSLAAALEAALELKANGHHDWFRGQNHDYRPVLPTLHRLDPDDQERALQKLARFETWVNETPGLEAIRADADAVLAVAQHHGLPTPFVDFSTDPRVAAFFAAVPHDAPLNDAMTSCIICLGTEDLDQL